MLTKQYTVVDNGSFIQFVGVAGTPVAGLTFSLQKQNITKLSEKDNAGSVAFFMADSTVTSFHYSELIDPATGFPFVDIGTAVAYFLSIGSVAGGGGGSAITADGDTMYSNVTGDFTATVTDGTKDITIVFVPCPQIVELQAFDETNIVSLQLINSTPELITLPISGCTVALGVITVNNAADNFALGDKVIVTIQGPKKSYSKVYDSIKTLVQNPEYAHATVPQVLANAVTTELVVRLTAQNGVPGPTFENDGVLVPFGEDNIALGSVAYNLTTGGIVTVPSGITAVTPNVSIEGTLDAGDWNFGDEGIFSGVRRYVTSMDTYKHFTLQYQLISRAVADELFMKIYGTNNVNADSSSLDGWIDLSMTLLGAGSIYANASEENGIVFPTYTILAIEKLMIEIIGSTDSAVPQDIEYTLIIKKS